MPLPHLISSVRTPVIFPTKHTLNPSSSPHLDGYHLTLELILTQNIRKSFDTYLLTALLTSLQFPCASKLSPPQALNTCSSCPLSPSLADPFSPIGLNVKCPPPQTVLFCHWLLFFSFRALITCGIVCLFKFLQLRPESRDDFHLVH